MTRFYLGEIALTTVTLLTGGSLLFAEAPKAQSGKSQERCAAFAARLNLTDKQKEEMRKVRTEFHEKMATLQKQLGTQRHEQFQAIKQVLTEEQRAKLPDVMKAEWDSRWQKLAVKLNLSEEQSQKIARIRAEYRGKFKQLATSEGEKQPEKFRELRHEAFKAVAAELTADQRSKFWSAFREEHHHRHNASARGKEHEAFAEKLSLSPEQRKRVEKICAEFTQKRAEPVAQLKQLRQDEHAAMAKVLTAEQRDKLHEMRQECEKGEKRQD